MASLLFLGSYHSTFVLAVPTAWKVPLSSCSLCPGLCTNVTLAERLFPWTLSLKQDPLPQSIPLLGFMFLLSLETGFPDSSASKESTCNAGDPSLSPGLGRSPGEGIGYSFQYSWASLVVQMVKNPPAMQETWVWSLGWEDPLEKGMTTYSSILAWRIPWTGEPGRLRSMESQSHTRLSYFHFLIRNGLDAFKNSRVFRIETSSSPFYLPFPMFSPGIWNIWFSKSDQTSWFILFVFLLLVVL